MKYLFVLLCLMLGTTAFSQTKITGKDYYVSPNGNDANNGSKSHPVNYHHQRWWLEKISPEG